jgi:Na+-transporting methylmalonyl-CoA/oxaloacetate decarboxylase gamma subunit
MKSLLTVVGFVLVLLVISVFPKIIGGVAGEHLAKEERAKEEAASRASFQAKLDEVSRVLNANLPKMVDENIRMDMTCPLS